MDTSKLSPDYRNLDTDDSGLEIITRILTPVLHIDMQERKYKATLGAYVHKKGIKVFVPASSRKHNWVVDENKIKPLPYDIAVLIDDYLSGINSDDLGFPFVLRVLRDGIEGVEAVIDPAVFTEANLASRSSVLSGDIPGLKADLYPYQEHGVAWMLDALTATGGLILADEMGLGKTLQIIALMMLEKPSSEHPALIICPTTLIANWCREISRFAPSMTYLVHRGINRTGYYKALMRSHIVISTYDTLTNDIALFQGVTWSYLICDEAQAAKNPESKRRVALGKVPRKYSIPVTGTPMENTLLDLWSLSDLAIPGLLGDKGCFSEIYPDTEEGAVALEKVLGPIILKRQVSDVADDLPDRTDIDFPIELDDSGREEYSRIKKEIIQEYGRAGNLVAVGQLALYCAHPSLQTKDIDKSGWEDNVELKESKGRPLATPKMDVCINILREAIRAGRKVLIFAVYNNCGHLIRKAVKSNSISIEYWNSINGSTPQEERQCIVDQFSEHVGPAVLVLNPKAAGTGLNITAATVVIHYTQNWNPALEMQASARAHRRGQSMPVHVYRLYYLDTVEEVMIERSQWKRDLGNSAVPISTREKQDLGKVLSVSP